MSKKFIIKAIFNNSNLIDDGGGKESRVVEGGGWGGVTGEPVNLKERNNILSRSTINSWAYLKCFKVRTRENRSIVNI